MILVIFNLNGQLLNLNLLLFLVIIVLILFMTFYKIFIYFGQYCFFSFIYNPINYTACINAF